MLLPSTSVFPLTDPTPTHRPCPSIDRPPYLGVNEPVPHSKWGQQSNPRLLQLLQLTSNYDPLVPPQRPCKPLLRTFTVDQDRTPNEVPVVVPPGPPSLFSTPPETSECPIRIKGRESYGSRETRNQTTGPFLPMFRGRFTFHLH